MKKIINILLVAGAAVTAMIAVPAVTSGITGSPSNAINNTGQTLLKTQPETATDTLAKEWFAIDYIGLKD